MEFERGTCPITWLFEGFKTGIVSLGSADMCELSIKLFNVCGSSASVCISFFFFFLCYNIATLFIL